MKYIYLFTILLCTSGYSDQISVLFGPGTDDQISVLGHTKSVNNFEAFKSKQSNSNVLFSKIKTKINQGFTGLLKAELVNKTSNTTEFVEFYGSYGEDNTFKVYADLENGTTIRWSEPKMTTDDQDIDLMDNEIE